MMRILNNLSAGAALFLMLLAAGAAASCGRRGGPSPERKPAGTAAAPPAAATPQDVVESEPPNEGERAADSEQVRGEVVLTRATAGQLLGAIRASGKRGTIVNAWASWCGPCRREVPMLQALATNLKPQGVEIVLVSVDEPKDEAKARSFLKDNAIALKSYLVEGSLAEFKEGINANWPGMLPASFLFDGAGTLVHFWGGEAFENEIVPVVESFLAGRPVEAETRYGLAPGKVE